MQIQAMSTTTSESPLDEVCLHEETTPSDLTKQRKEAISITPELRWKEEECPPQLRCKPV